MVTGFIILAVLVLAFAAYKIGRRGGKKGLGVVAAAKDVWKHPFQSEQN